MNSRFYVAGMLHLFDMLYNVLYNKSTAIRTSVSAFGQMGHCKCKLIITVSA